jgi:YfiH family protein
MVNDWLASGITAGFTSRAGGSSSIPYESMNLGLHVGDNSADVLVNRGRLASAIAMVPERFVYAQQVHGNRAKHVGKHEAGRGAFSYDDAIDDVDGLVTSDAGVVLMTLAADCVPVLCAGLESHVIGTAHAGWRGATSGVISSTVTMMYEQGVSAKELHVAIGPAIRGCCYEVDEPVAAAVRSAYHRFAPQSEPALRHSPRSNDRYMLDIPTLIRDELLTLGVHTSHIQDMGVCTQCDPDYFSYRRENGQTGRQGAFIYIKQGD